MPAKSSSMAPGHRFTGRIEAHQASGIPRLEVPADIVAVLRQAGRAGAGPNRVIATLNGYSFHAAIMPQGEIGYIMMTGKVRTGGGVEVGDTVTLEVAADQSEHGLPMPAELDEALKFDREGARLFAALTPGRQRGLMALVDRQRRPDARADKALALLDGLRCGITDLKELARHKVSGRVFDEVRPESPRKPPLLRRR